MWLLSHLATGAFWTWWFISELEELALLALGERAAEEHSATVWPLLSNRALCTGVAADAWRALCRNRPWLLHGDDLSIEATVKLSAISRGGKSRIRDLTEGAGLAIGNLASATRLARGHAGSTSESAHGRSSTKSLAIAFGSAHGSIRSGPLHWRSSERLALLWLEGTTEAASLGNTAAASWLTHVGIWVGRKVESIVCTSTHPATRCIGWKTGWCCIVESRGLAMLWLGCLHMALRLERSAAALSWWIAGRIAAHCSLLIAFLWLECSAESLAYLSLLLDMLGLERAAETTTSFSLLLALLLLERSAEAIAIRVGLQWCICGARRWCPAKLHHAEQSGRTIRPNDA